MGTDFNESVPIFVEKIESPHPREAQAMKIDKLCILISHEGKTYYVHCRGHGGIIDIADEDGKVMNSESKLYRQIFNCANSICSKLAAVPNRYGETGTMHKKRAAAFKRK